MPAVIQSPPAADLPAPPLPDPLGCAVFADLDGTLAEIRETPGAVTADKERRRLLDRLQTALGGRLAIISGRGLADLDRVLEGRIAAVGAVHGLVRRTARGVVSMPAEATGVASAGAAFDDLARRHPGLLVENKEAAAALHFRRSPVAADACLALAERLAASHDLTVQQGDMVVEVRARGADKGDAVRAFMAEPPFAGATPVFIGDDLTDENGFDAVQALGGFGVVVGARRPTLARYALADVAAATSWLNRLAEARA